jgi:RNA polymerase sigma-70 factor (ECF subfamily)
LLLEEREREIICRAQQNPRSFAPLYDHYFPKIYNYIYHRVQDSQLAEDLVAETFYKALSNIHKFKWQGQGYSFASWLYTIARNQVIDQFRRREPLLLDEGSWEFITPGSGNPEDKVLRDVTREELLKAIQTLSPNQQDALLLRFQEGLKIKEIASVLDKKEGAIKALLFRGLKSLRKKLEGGDYNAAI